MPKPPLREPFRSLEHEIIAGHSEWRPDLAFPESYSDMQGAVRALLRKYEVKLWLVPLDRAQIEQPHKLCVICAQPLSGYMKVVMRHSVNGVDQDVVHVDCVKRPGDNP